MNNKLFDKLVRKHVGATLEPYGFTCEKSRHSTFYRQASDEIYHVVFTELGGGGSWFHFEIVPVSSLIIPDFESNFPDDFGFPNGGRSRLHSRLGVGMDRTTFRCSKEEGFVRNYQGEAELALESIALPYLDKIQTLKELRPYVTADVSEFYLGATLWHLGKKRRATKILKRERQRLLELNQHGSDKISKMIAYIDALI